jgi:hypothetical protein
MKDLALSKWEIVNERDSDSPELSPGVCQRVFRLRGLATSPKFVRRPFMKNTPTANGEIRGSPASVQSRAIPGGWRAWGIDRALEALILKALPRAHRLAANGLSEFYWFLSIVGVRNAATVKKIEHSMVRTIQQAFDNGRIKLHGR